MKSHGCIGVLLGCVVCVGLSPSPASAQTGIATDHKYVWAENIGWTNWRDAAGGTAGVIVKSTYLQGYVWAENAGWIHLGDGSPANGASYQNADSSDYGVNIAGDGDLFGYGWGENIGWINFDTGTTLEAMGQQARYDAAAGRFRGYAWGEGIGWINLDDNTWFVAVECPGGCNDGNPCTTDQCQLGIGCLYNPNSLPCDDGEPCTTGDSCSGGVCSGTPGNCTCPVDGNVTSSAEVTVADVQCVILVSLWQLGGGGASPPACLTSVPAAADLNCDGSVNVADIVIDIGKALGMPLDSGLDSNANACVDACE